MKYDDGSVDVYEIDPKRKPYPLQSEVLADDAHVRDLRKVEIED